MRRAALLLPALGICLLCALFCFSSAGEVTQIQGIPTPWMYVNRQLSGLFNPQAWWNMDENATNSIRADDTCHRFDAYPYDNTGTKVQINQFTGIVNFASAVFDQTHKTFITSNSITGAKIDGRGTNAPFSWQVWYWATNNNDSGAAFIGSTPDWNAHTSVGNQSSGDFVWIANQPNAGVENQKVTNIFNGVWHHVLGVFDGTTNLVLYVDNIPATNGMGTFNGGIVRTNFLSLINDALAGNQPDHSIDECAYWTNALTAAQVSFLFNSGQARHLALQCPQVFCHQLPGPSATYAGGVVTVANTIPGYNTIFVTFDSSLPNPGVIQGATSTAYYSNSVPPGTWTYDGPFTLPWNATITSMGSVGCGCNPSCLMDSAYTTNSFVSLGENWSNNVVANGGTVNNTFGTQSVTNINALGAALNNAGIMAQTPVGIVAANIFGRSGLNSMSLIAFTTPYIYVAGSQLWTNHNFVAGDVSANGLTGDGSTKFLDTGIVPSADGIAGTEGAFSSYAYVTNSNAGAGEDIGAIDGTPNFWRLDSSLDNGGLSILFDCFGTTGGRLSAAGSPVLNGFYVGSRTSNTSSTIYFANSGVAWASLASSATSQGTPPTTRLFVFAINNNGVAADFSNGTYSSITIGRGLSSIQGQKLFNAVQIARQNMGGGFR